MKGSMKALFATAAVFSFAAAANASLSIALLGTAATPASIGGLAMTHAPADTGSAVFADVTSVAYKPGSSLTFSSAASHRQIGLGWATWSHGYTGDVYYTNGATSITMSFTQADLFGFSFYVESNPFGPFTASISATNAAGETLAGGPQAGDGGSGACGFGVTSTSRITSITISSVISAGAPVDFAVGDFSYSKVPAPGALALLGLAGFTSRRRRA